SRKMAHCRVRPRPSEVRIAAVPTGSTGRWLTLSSPTVVAKVRTCSSVCWRRSFRARATRARSSCMAAWSSVRLIHQNTLPESSRISRISAAIGHTRRVATVVGEGKPFTGKRADPRARSGCPTLPHVSLNEVSFSVARAAFSLHQPQAAKARVAVAADDDVVVHQDAERFGDLADGPRHLDVGGGGRRIARGVVVHQ